MNVILFSEIVEENGRTIRENNLEKQHKFSLGMLVKTEADIYHECGESQVNLKGVCILYVVGHTRDCDGTPLYVLSDIPVEYPINSEMWGREKLLYKEVSNLILRNIGEDSLVEHSKGKPLYENLREFLS